MSFVDFFKFKKGVKVVAEQPTPDRSGRNAILAIGLRRNMWVADADNRVGILTDANAEGIATVMLVQDDGTNLMQVNTMLANLRMARHAEIPGPRRPDADRAAQFGYR